MPSNRHRPELPLPRGRKTKKDSKSQSFMDRLKKFYKEQWEDDKKRAANKTLLKAVGMFVGGVVLFRTAGESLFL